MNPIKFEEANKIFTAPKGMENCGDLHVHDDGENLISCWEMTREEKIMALFFGRVWLYVVGRAQPPVALLAQQTVFANKGESDEEFWKRQEKDLEAFVERKASQFVDRYKILWSKTNILTLDKNDYKGNLKDFLIFALGFENVDQSAEKV